MQRLKRVIMAAMIFSLLLAAVGCVGKNQPAENGGSSANGVQLSAGGASFPYPLYTKWIDVYSSNNPDVKVDYQSIGSGGGIKGIIDKTFDFAGSDAPMTDEELAGAPGEILHIPTVMGAVVVTYNIPGVDKTIKLNADALADIFLGKITKWNDSRLTAINSGITLPDTDIIVVRRSDGSGTTNTFTDYLDKVSTAWHDAVGMGKSVEWPVGLGGKGNEGVAGQIAQTAGAIGYVELAYAEQNNLPMALLKNAAGKFVEPTLDTTAAAAAGALANMPEDMRVSITNAPGEDAWPIATFTYLLVYKKQDDPVKGKAVLDYIWWAVSEGDSYARELLYAPTPDSLKQKIKEKLATVTYNGEPLLK